LAMEATYPSKGEARGPIRRDRGEHAGSFGQNKNLGNGRCRLPSRDLAAGGLCRGAGPLSFLVLNMCGMLGIVPGGIA